MRSLDCSTVRLNEVYFVLPGSNQHVPRVRVLNNEAVACVTSRMLAIQQISDRSHWQVVTVASSSLVGTQKGDSDTYSSVPSGSQRKAGPSPSLRDIVQRFRLPRVWTMAMRHCLNLAAVLCWSSVWFVVSAHVDLRLQIAKRLSLQTSLPKLYPFTSHHVCTDLRLMTCLLTNQRESAMKSYLGARRSLAH
ncbi:hypothetical protein K469DRAFT_328179 [Zopfia rhizophila CBS 207.26]|uniref:Uncharacterized protein n=1 Tax=Zopfia rhizophila CBS 207.26 TaxID=1314779 RepID=A0A6A6DG78_9PEZI|nr:hypothetical protein K469DRAFT_328179 [Zopfia rhizophila CBS 207.26]